jgi:hypothetical protein
VNVVFGGDRFSVCVGVSSKSSSLESSELESEDDSDSDLFFAGFLFRCVCCFFFLFSLFSSPFLLNLCFLSFLLVFGRPIG